MSFVVSARKYRPQNFDELIGQDHIATTLRNAIKNDKLAHAFLFSGPRGVGKTTSARILARVLNCQNLSPEFHACGECGACTSFNDNASFNIFELDAASNNSVDHIRSLNDQVRFQPQQGSYKIYIIDEVHMLSQAAFNAFLKTLEEPPPYAKFILATTEKHKIIPTILSRCQIFDFRRIQVKDIVTQIREIAKKEQREFDEEALHLIGQKADGAMRDALSIYDKIVSTIEGPISYKDVASNLNVLDHDYYFEIVDAAIKEDFPAIMLKFDEIVRNGFEVEQFTLGLLGHLRQLLLVKDIQTAKLMEISESLMQRYENQALLASSSFLLSSLSIVEKADLNLVRSQNKRLTMEIGLSKMAYMNRVVEKKSLAKSRAEKPQQTPQSATVSSVNFKNTIDSKVSKTKPIDQKKSQEHVKEKVKKTETRATVKKKYLSLTPSISADIDQLVAEIAEEETVKKNTVSPFTVKYITSILQEWKNKSKYNSFKTAIDNTKVELSGDQLKILTPTEIYLEMLKQDLKLIEEIRNRYPARELEILFRVELSAFPDYKVPEKTKVLSTIEKIELFKKTNQDFGPFYDKFRLKPQ